MTFWITVELIDEKSAIVFSINRQLLNPIWSTPGYNDWPQEERDKHRGIKLDRPVELSNIIRVPVSGSESGNELYSLVATIEHRTTENSISAGHYICYLKFRDEWYFANDRQPLTRQGLLNRWTSQLDLGCTTGWLERVVSVHNST